MTVDYENKELDALQPFLESSVDDLSNQLPSQLLIEKRRKQAPQLWKWCMVFTHLSVLATYSIIFLFAIKNRSSSSLCSSEILPLPAREAVQWELRQFSTSLIDNPFTGTPRPELEQAWHGLLKNDHIKVLHQTLKALNLTSVQLKDGSGDIASLGTFHALHCLKKVRQMTYKEHYHHGKDTTQMIREQAHSDHCIEYIREYLMCKPDLSLVTLHWINNTAQHPNDPSLQLPTSWDHSLHECTNWEAFNNWAGERVFDLYQYNLLQEPDNDN